MQLRQTATNRVCVWGAGAIGKLVAASLQMAGIDVTVKVRRAEQAARLREHGIVLYSQTSDPISVPIRVTDRVDDLDAGLIILTVKSFDTQQAAGQIAGMKSLPIVLSLQNGLGNDELLADVLAGERIFTAMTTYGATSLSDFAVAARGEGELVLGSYFGNGLENANQLKAIFSEAGWNVRIGQNMLQEVWKKAFINIGINPVTAIHRVTNGEIIKVKELQELASAAVAEAEVAACAAGILTAGDIGNGTARMLQVCRQTAANRSSMLQDIEKGRKTEIDALNGRIVQLGEACAIDTPVNRELVRQIKNLEQRADF